MISKSWNKKTQNTEKMSEIDKNWIIPVPKTSSFSKFPFISSMKPAVFSTKPNSASQSWCGASVAQFIQPLLSLALAKTTGWKWGKQKQQATTTKQRARAQTKFDPQKHIVSSIFCTTRYHTISQCSFFLPQVAVSRRFSPLWSGASSLHVGSKLPLDASAPELSYHPFSIESIPKKTHKLHHTFLIEWNAWNKSHSSVEGGKVGKSKYTWVLSESNLSVPQNIVKAGDNRFSSTKTSF